MPGLLPYHEPELLRQMAEGNAQAFQQLFNAYERRLYTFAYKLTSSREATEDIVQDIFLALWKSREKATGIENLNAYLHRAVHNACMRSLRTMARETLAHHLLRTSGETGLAEDPGHHLLSKEVRQQVQVLVDQLSPKQRQVFQLSREEGLKQDEIAQRMGIAVTTVKTHLSEALKLLRSGLSDHYGPQAIAIIVIWQLGNI